MKNKSKIIPLNIVMTYPVRWGKYKILRDFVQNFYDSVGFQKWNDCFKYEYKNKSLEMWVDDIVFSYEWLLHIGASTKTADTCHHAGYFGEGFKIASLCAIRDYGWYVTMSSGDWKIKVISTQQEIDHTNVKMLAYDLTKVNTQNVSRLKLCPIESEDFILFQSVIHSFYYKENPLFGDNLWEGNEGAVYLCNTDAYDDPLPYTIDFGRKGVVFCSFQMLGSNPFGLAVCIHNYGKDDRERSSLYSFQVVGAFETISYYISPYGAMNMLERMRRYWNSVPKKGIDLHSWNPVIRNLINRVASSSETLICFQQKYSNLLCVKPVHTIGDKNRREQARAWLASQSEKYLLVQENFARLGYPELEEVCEQQGGFVVNGMANDQENKGFAVLENLVREIYKNFFGEGGNIPHRKIISNDNASYHGMAKVYKKAHPVRNSHGVLIRYEVGEIYLKRSIFCKNGYYDALSTYVHELCHAFGGDASNSFSLGLTHAMEILLTHGEIIEGFKTHWDSIYH